MRQEHCAVEAADYYAMASLYWSFPQESEVYEVYTPQALRDFLEEGYRIITQLPLQHKTDDVAGQQVINLSQQESYITEVMGLLPTQEKLRSFFARYFLPAHARKGAPLIESVYRPWTEDPHNAMPFKHDEGYVMGDSSQYMSDVLSKLEVDVPSHVMPDDLCVELSVASLLCEYAPAVDVRDFLTQRFAWLPKLSKRLRQEAGDCLHARLLDQLIFVNATLVARLASEDKE